MKRKVVSMLLISAMAIASIACGNQETGGETSEENSTESLGAVGEEAGDMVYIPSYQEINSGIEGYLSYFDLYGTESVSVISKENEGLEIYLYDVESMGEVKVAYPSLYENSYVSKAQLLSDGTIAVLESAFIEDENTGEVTEVSNIQVIDREGNSQKVISMEQLFDQIRQSNPYAMISNMLIDENGNIYVPFETSLFVLDEAGQIKSSLDFADWISTIGIRNQDSIYVITSNEKSTLHMVNTLEQEIETTIEDVPFSGMPIAMLDADSLIYSDGKAAYKYYLASGESEELFQWLDANIDGNSIKNFGILGDQSVLVLEHNMSASTSGVYTFTETLVSEVSGKEEVILATLQLSDELKNRVLRYNKSSSEYEIEVVEYLAPEAVQGSQEEYQEALKQAITELNQDMADADGPDLLDIDVHAMSMEAMIEDGLLENLLPFFEASGVQESDFITSALDLAKEGEELYYLPGSFVVQSMFADSSIVGTTGGWSLEEAARIAREIPDDMEFMSYGTKDSVLQVLLDYGYQSFVDLENKEVNFDSEEFMALLELANSFPEDYQFDPNGDPDQLRIQDGRLLVYQQHIWNLSDFAMVEDVFEGMEYTAVGIPGVGGNGTVLSWQGPLVAVTSNSDQKEAAADFVIQSITRAEGELYGLPMSQELFDKNVGSFAEPLEMTSEQILRFNALIDGAKATNLDYDPIISSIIMEEVAPYFTGQKSIEEVVDIIQSRVGIYVNEQ